MSENYSYKFTEPIGHPQTAPVKCNYNRLPDSTPSTISHTANVCKFGCTFHAAVELLLLLCRRTLPNRMWTRRGVEVPPHRMPSKLSVDMRSMTSFVCCKHNTHTICSWVFSTTFFSPNDCTKQLDEVDATNAQIMPYIPHIYINCYLFCETITFYGAYWQ